ncbi:hypothetical protein B0H16DRAFT_1752226 [Mycena metata]|uniref:DUF6589 domain-containing protein n=1 Tax=Mycena metata TaxID=1033252 RepID=A0AAD7DIG5_9AGAR|nr:hypothetical protein B0H16DRAFT_1752226 [Mycena metata]
MEIDENSMKGNIEVIEAINKELGLDLTIARQRSILQVRLGHESGAQAWKHIVLMPGLFHAKIADCHGVLHTHFGKPSAGFRSPGSLGFHNRLPITLTSLPPFRTCRDLIMVSLYARILHCLLLVSKKKSLEEYSEDGSSWETLVGHAEQINNEFTDADRVQELRELCVPEERLRDAELAAKAKGQRKTGTTQEKEHPPHIKKGDMVFENAILFMRDALLTREFADAIKAGDSGCIVLILKLFAFTYRGMGARSMPTRCSMSFIISHTILHNWLLCPTGKANAFVDVDLVQEHLNLWIKKIYKADGDGHSWDWLAFVSPCVDVLRRLATSINRDLGARQGNKHTIPDLDNDIQCLMASLTEHEVYVQKDGRVLDDDEMPVPDVLSAGAAALTHGTTSNPLQDFNAQFDQLRRRRELVPASSLTQYISESSQPLPPSSISEAQPGGSVAIFDAFTFAPPATVDVPGDNLTVNLDQLPQLVPSNPPEDEEEEEPHPDVDEDLFAESPTLTRLDPEGVDLDMDDDWMLDPDSDSGSDYGSEDEANIQRSGSESD